MHLLRRDAEALVYKAGGSFNYSIAGADRIHRAGRITPDQASTLGAKACEKALPLERRSDAIANLVYSKRMSNNGHGDGWNYRRRGLIRITGLNNHRVAVTGSKLSSFPIRIYWHRIRMPVVQRGSSRLRVSEIFRSDMVRVTQIINGGQRTASEIGGKRFETKSVLV